MMAFPQDKLDRVVYLFYDGAFNDISTYVYQREPITITRGRTDETALTQHARCSLTLDNRDGRFSPRDPDGALFGKIGRNAPIEVGVRLGQRFLRLDGVGTDYISAPDSAGLSITGDIDVRLDVGLESWRRLSDLAGKYGSAGQRSWGLQLTEAGLVQWTWSVDGTAITQVTSLVPVPWPQTGRATLRVTHDVNNGLGGYTITFWYSTTPGVAGPWTQLGNAVSTTAGTTSIFDSTAAVVFGAVNNGSASLQPGRVHAGEIRNGIGGSVVATPDLRGQAESAASFSDGTNTWTVGGGGVITNYRVEFSGEIPDWPVDRDTSGNDIWVSVTASGVLRRLSQGASPVQSTLRKALPSIGAALRAYWPLEDGERATSAVSALGGRPMTWGSPAPSLAAYSGFDGSDPLPTLEGSSPRGAVPFYASTGTIQLRFLLAVPAGGATNNAVVARLTCGGSVARWDVIYTTGGALTLTGYDSTGTSLGTSGPIGFAINGKNVMVSVELDQNGADVDYTIAVVEAGRDSGTFDISTITTDTITNARAVQLNPGGSLTDTAVGHVTVENAITDLFTFGRPLDGYAQENAGRRIERLCSEQGIGFLPFGDLDTSAQMGPQRSDTLVNLLRECELTDAGTLFEARHKLAVAYQPRTTLYSPGTRVTLVGGAGSGGQLLSITSTDDDQLTRNDVTAIRRAGSSVRVEDATSALSTAAPPAGVGRYDDDTTLNVLHDDDLPDQAGWRLHLGTIDEPRFPQITVSLARAALVADPGTTTACLDADLGDSVTITSPGVALPATDVRQVVAGLTHVLSSNDLQVSWVGQPATGYDVGLFDYEHPDEESRYSSDGSTANGAHAAGTTSLSVATPTGPLWSHADGDFTISVPSTGERMLVTAVAGAGSPQTFTVTRGVEGTTAKALVGGEEVALARPIYWGL